MIAADVAITRTESGRRGRYEARIAGSDEPAELTWSRMNAETIVADHTFVPNALRGRGIGTALVERLVADARDGGYRVVPQCPFIRALYGRHPEWSDIMQ